MGRMKRLEDSVNKMAVFIDNTNGKAYTIRIPDLEDYGNLV
jgi:hypothetical protein